MKIHLPNSAWLNNIQKFLETIDMGNPNVLEITSHKDWVSVHPVVLCMIISLGIAVKQAKGHVKFAQMTAKSKYYFKRMDVFKLLDLESDIKLKEHEHAGKFIPIRRISDSKELDDFIKEVTPLLHKGKDERESINYILFELIRNVLEHSQDKSGAIVCAQYYKKSNTIRIGVVDYGVGIRKTISKFHKVIDELNAIELALTPGVTGTTSKIGGGGTEENAGAGLFFIKSISITNRSFFMIYSGNSMYKLLKPKPIKNPKRLILYANPKKDRHKSFTNLPAWRGTAIGVDICLDNTQDFNSLLTLIRKIYSKGKKEKSKEKYRKAKFI